MKKGALLLGSCACFLIFALLCFPAEMLAASAKGVQLWLTKVFPSLFPFLVACGILLRIGAAQRMGAALRPLMQPLFHLPGIAAFPFFFGLLSGYPMGAKLTAQLYEQRQLSLADAQQLLAFSNCPGPLFLIGTVGVGFFGMPAFGYLLWLSAFLGAVATGILFRRKKSVPTFHSVSVPSCQTLTEVLSASVADALRTILLIGGYLILFAVLSAAMEQAGLFSLLSRLLFFLPLSTETLRGFCSGILEMTNGAHLLSLSPDGLRLRLTLVAFLVSFGGLSILGQTFGVLAAMPISKKRLHQREAYQCPFQQPFFLFALSVFLSIRTKRSSCVFFAHRNLFYALFSLAFAKPVFPRGALLCNFPQRIREIICPYAAPEYFPPEHPVSARSNHLS